MYLYGPSSTQADVLDGQPHALALLALDEQRRALPYVRARGEGERADVVDARTEDVEREPEANRPFRRALEVREQEREHRRILRVPPSA
jgi:hypothetical protein